MTQGRIRRRLLGDKVGFGARLPNRSAFHKVRDVGERGANIRWLLAIQMNLCLTRVRRTIAASIQGAVQ